MELNLCYIYVSSNVTKKSDKLFFFLPQNSIQLLLCVNLLVYLGEKKGRRRDGKDWKDTKDDID